MKAVRDEYGTVLEMSEERPLPPTEKLRWDLLLDQLLRANEATVAVLTHGVDKHGNTWRQVPRWHHVAALGRHLTEWLRGATIDPDSGCHPLAHVACRVLFLLELDLERLEGVQDIRSCVEALRQEAAR